MKTRSPKAKPQVGAAKPEGEVTFTLDLPISWHLRVRVILAKYGYIYNIIIELNYTCVKIFSGVQLFLVENRCLSRERHILTKLLKLLKYYI